ncbi:hypothetical protein D3C78_1443910 [compost metagenome]
MRPLRGACAIWPCSSTGWCCMCRVGVCGAIAVVGRAWRSSAGSVATSASQTGWRKRAASCFAAATSRQSQPSSILGGTRSSPSTRPCCLRPLRSHNGIESSTWRWMSLRCTRDIATPQSLSIPSAGRCCGLDKGAHARRHVSSSSNCPLVLPSASAQSRST